MICENISVSRTFRIGTKQKIRILGELRFELDKPQLLLSSDALPLDREASLHHDSSCKNSTCSGVVYYALQAFIIVCYAP